MKKVLLGALILILIVAVSWVKTLREQERSEAFYKQGVNDATQQSADAQSEADSLKLVLAENQLAMADSLTRKDKTYGATIDSLEQELEDEKSRSKTLAEETTPAENVVPEKTISKHEQILTYYKRRYANLPKDLSEYELRIALNEIREETSQKFAITLTELKEIRQKNKLSY